MSEPRDPRLLERLRDGARALDLGMPEPALQRLLTYLCELERWNQTYNLTAVRDLGEMVPRHALDSLAVHRFVAGPRVADAGTGAGLPGIPLALALPGVQMTLIDSGIKKVRFLRHVVGLLALPTVEVVHARIEDYPAATAFDTVIARALAPVPRLLALAGHLCRPGGRMLAMQGRRQDAELSALPHGWDVAAVEQLTVPQLDAQRHLIVLRRADDA
jgi:16S rRNA (guanine527-N7)-methyltransferase